MDDGLKKDGQGFRKTVVHIAKNHVFKQPDYCCQAIRGLRLATSKLSQPSHSFIVLRKKRCGWVATLSAQL